MKPLVYKVMYIIEQIKIMVHNSSFSNTIQFKYSDFKLSINVSGSSSVVTVMFHTGL